MTVLLEVLFAKDLSNLKQMYLGQDALWNESKSLGIPTLQAQFFPKRGQGQHFPLSDHLFSPTATPALFCLDEGSVC